VGLFAILRQRLLQNASVFAILVIMVFLQKVEMVEIYGVWIKNSDNFSVFLFEAGKMPRTSPQPKKILEVDTSEEYSEPWVLSGAR
jgi:hypothetical protein